MKCSETNRLLDAYIDGELAGATAERIKAHLDSCSDCRQALASVQALNQQLVKDERAPYLKGSIRAAIAANSSSQAQEKKMKQALLRKGMATAMVLTAALALTLSVPSSASASWKKVQDAVANVKTAKITVWWATPSGKKDHKIVWCDEKRVRMEYSNGQVEIFDGKLSHGDGPPGTQGDAMGSISPSDFRIDFQMRSLSRDGKKPFALADTLYQGKKHELLGIEGASNQRFVFWVDPATNYPSRMVEEVRRGGSWQWESELVYELDVPLNDSLFVPSGRVEPPVEEAVVEASVID